MRKFIFTGMLSASVRWTHLCVLRAHTQMDYNRLRLINGERERESAAAAHKYAWCKHIRYVYRTLYEYTIASINLVRSFQLQCSQECDYPLHSFWTSRLHISTQCVPGSFAFLCDQCRRSCQTNTIALTKHLPIWVRVIVCSSYVCTFVCGIFATRIGQ